MIDAIWKAKFEKVAEPKRYDVREGNYVEFDPTKGVAGPDSAGVIPKESRQAKWKRLNPGKVREAQKMLMRKRRAK